MTNKRQFKIFFLKRTTKWTRPSTNTNKENSNCPEKLSKQTEVRTKLECDCELPLTCVKDEGVAESIVSIVTSVDQELCVWEHSAAVPAGTQTHKLTNKKGGNLLRKISAIYQNLLNFMLNTT